MTTKLKKFWKFFRNDIGELAKKPSSADLSSADLGKELFGDINWNEKTNWEGVRGLETAKNLPEALKQQLGLDIPPKEDEN